MCAASSADPSTLAAPVTPLIPQGAFELNCCVPTSTIQASPASACVHPRSTPPATSPAPTNIDFYSSDFRDRPAGLDKDRTYRVYCQIGNRSAQATAVMHAMGFKHVYDVQGWYRRLAAGRPAHHSNRSGRRREAGDRPDGFGDREQAVRAEVNPRTPEYPWWSEPVLAVGQPARYTVYRCGMSTERIQDWFATMPPQARVDWLETGQTGVGLTAVLLRTLPEEHRPGHADAWVFGPVYPKWLLTAAESPAYVLSEQFGEFLAAEYSRWYGGE